MSESNRAIFSGDPPLADTLCLMMPSAPTTLLLQAGLLQDETAVAAWSRWRQTVEESKAFLASDRTGIKRHLPLLYWNLVAQGAVLGREMELYLRCSRP